MLRIPCPWCGPRDEPEFQCGGQSHMVRPEPWHEVAEATWGDYLFTRQNPKGLHLERWVHINGCRQWFNVARNTVTHEIVAVYRMTDPVPAEVASAMSVAGAQP